MTNIIRAALVIVSLLESYASLGSDTTTSTMTRIARVPAIQANNQAISLAIRGRVSRVKSDMRSLATAVESYAVDNNVYPPAIVGGAECKRATKPGEKPVSSFRGSCLTTPIAYCTGFFHDPFEQAGQTFGYFEKTKGDKHGWILFSAGPDGKIDLDWNVYDPAIDQPSNELITKYTYDPTNGTASRGDVWRVKQ